MVGGDGQLWRVPLQGAIVVCYVWNVTTNFGGVDVHAMAGYHCSVPLKYAIVGREGDEQVWGSGRGALAGCVVVCRG